MANNQTPEDVHRRYVEAFNSGDVQPLLDLYEPDASLVPQPETVVSGHAAIGEALSQYQAIGKMTAETRYCIQSADVALASASWSVEGVLTANPSPFAEPAPIYFDVRLMAGGCLSLTIRSELPTTPRPNLTSPQRTESACRATPAHTEPRTERRFIGVP
jgi:ketosteroid isomerase-like protein